MIPQNQGSSLFQNSSLNRTPRENYNISRYKDPNAISQDVPDRERTVISVAKGSDPEGETVTCGSPYKLAMLNSPKRSHLGKTIISPNW